MPSLLDDLNPEQREAVVHDGGPLLILAGAGSGKTRVITRRVAHLILERRVDPQSILAITFTNKAAREMKERVARYVPRSDLWVSTFHSAAARILRRDAPSVGYPRDFTIYDTYDRGQCLRTVIRELGLDDGRWRPAAVGAWISARKNRGLAPGEAEAEGLPLDETLATIEKAYAERMARSAALDFDDLLVLCLKVFAETGDRWAGRFEHVLVDEYQDTNAIQYRMTSFLARASRNLGVCGDPDQSIYGWRGADLRNILEFERDFAPATVVKLETSYRSSSRIVAAAQSLIEHNSARKAKVLRTDNPPGERLVEMESRDELDEARAIAGRIRDLVAREGHRYSDVAIFYRANFLQRALERALREGPVPYRVAAGLEFFERREIKDLLAYLRALANPLDDVSFERIVNVPTRGIGDATLDRLRQAARDRGVPLRAALASAEVRGAFVPRVRNALDDFDALLGRLAPAIDGAAEAALETVIDATRYDDYCGDLGDSGDQDRLENVRELVASAAEYDRREGGGVRGFLGEVALVSDVDRIGGDGDQVTLMTLHSAKGLEFSVVFIAGLEEGLLPHRRSVEERAGAEGLEEERRLFYVGLTRARARVFLSYARSRTQYGADERTLRSRFLDEIPSELVEGGRDVHFDSPTLWDAEEPALPGGASLPAPGEYVRHETFGVGRVLECAGRGGNARAVVEFERVGRKQLLLQYARLEKVASQR
ncbi:MAG TPA: UvrD-helicase domain-containing protein [Planctomycetota bacterium]|nr:UvrD-helicase domain-containing protein [Planctomycetota bacterium]